MRIKEAEETYKDRQDEQDSEDRDQESGFRLQTTSIVSLKSVV